MVAAWVTISSPRLSVITDLGDAKAGSGKVLKPICGAAAEVVIHDGVGLCVALAGRLYPSSGS